MSFRGKRWIWPEQERPDPQLVRQANLDPALARLLVNRGITDPREARAFLCPTTENLHNPWQMLDLDKAVARITKAIEKGEKIIIHGDYDADGITATVIMVEAIRALGGTVAYFLPSRFDEGYGLHSSSLEQFKGAGADLVITVDCGINAAAEADYAASIGLELIITDHHQPLEHPARALAVVNPRQENCPYPFKELSGAGIAYKLASALYENAKLSSPENLLDLAALGTAADVVPLLGENRILVAAGLEVLRRLERTGFKALTQAVNLDPARLNSYALSFILAPAINAAGRMGAAEPAARLLLTEKTAEADELAASLHQANQERRRTEQQILREAEAEAAIMLAQKEHPILTLAGEGWHHGVIGIVASRLVERFNRPVALIALEGEEGRGSARSVEGFNITSALAEAEELLVRFGGHEQAAGFTVSADKVEALRDALNSSVAVGNLQADRLPRLKIESELAEADFNPALASGLEQLQPFGTANPAPLLGSRAWALQNWRLVGSDQRHLKLTFQKESSTIEPIFFSAAEHASKLEKGRKLDIAFRLKKSNYRGGEGVDIELVDLCYADRAEYRGLTVIDRRTSERQPGELNLILADRSAGQVVFISTPHRRSRLERQCHPAVCYINNGVANGSVTLPEEITGLILFDLPLTSGIIEALQGHCLKHKNLAIELFYNKSDLQRNRAILDRTLPTAAALESLFRTFIKQGTEWNLKDFSPLGKTVLGFKAADPYWDRVEKIFREIGVLDQGRFGSCAPDFIDDWPSRLAGSQTYNETSLLREQSESFQQRLLSDSPVVLAEYFYELLNNRPDSL